jgi:PLD-like domain
MFAINIEVKETDYFLPEDGQIAEAKFLEILNNPGETWIGAFGFTLQPMFDAIKKADAAGVKVHILLDHSQSGGTAEHPKVQDLVNTLKNGDVTITTAGLNSDKPSQIWHFKGMVVRTAGDLGDQADANDFNWEGSTNFSESAWFQGNSARVFQSADWADVFIKQQEAHRAWALAHEPQYQLKPGDPVTAAPVKRAAKVKVKVKKGKK